MSLFPKDIKEFEKQAFQCKHCKTVFMAGPNEWYYVKPEERRIQDEKDWSLCIKSFKHGVHIVNVRYIVQDNI